MPILVYLLGWVSQAIWMCVRHLVEARNLGL